MRSTTATGTTRPTSASHARPGEQEQAARKRERKEDQRPITSATPAGAALDAGATRSPYVGKTHQQAAHRHDEGVAHQPGSARRDSEIAARSPSASDGQNRRVEPHGLRDELPDGPLGGRKRRRQAPAPRVARPAPSHGAISGAIARSAAVDEAAPLGPSSSTAAASLSAHASRDEDRPPVGTVGDPTPDETRVLAPRTSSLLVRLGRSPSRRATLIFIPPLLFFLRRARPLLG